MENISDVGKKCFGCRSCEQVCPKHCITIELTKEGFLYPVIEEEKCIQCGLCLKACPTERVLEHRNKPQHVWAFKNKNTEELLRSASGGAADVAVGIVISQGGVAYGAAYDEKLAVRHIEVDDEEGKEKLQSSKYVQSDINNCYLKAKKALSGGRTVLFTGTPCQIAGLYAFLGGDRPNLYTIDLICHGVPSPKFFEKYLEYQERQKKDKVIYFNFRSKEKRGWGTQYLLKTKNKSETKSLMLDRYGKHFMTGDCYRECCYQCPFANTVRVGDITVGDFWGIAKSHPDFYSTQGVSSVFVNTDKGIELFERVKKLGDAIPATMEEGIVKQHNLVKPTVRSANREDFYNDIDEPDYIDKMKVGLQMKERIKAALPAETIKFIKMILKGKL